MPERGITAAGDPLPEQGHHNAQTFQGSVRNSGSVNPRQTNRRTSERVFPSKRLGKGKAKESLHCQRSSTVERWSPKPEDAGSNPAGGATRKRWNAGCRKGSPVEINRKSVHVACYRGKHRASKSKRCAHQPHLLIASGQATQEGNPRG